MAYTEKGSVFVTVSDSVDIEVDLVAEIKGLTDKQREAVVRALAIATPRGEDLYVERAYEELVAGRNASALAYLTSYLFPALHIAEARRAAQQKKAA